MNKIRFGLKTFAFVMFTLACATAAQAQATRTWVSGVGDDVNPCSRTAPCKTFAGAISKTADKGEIDCLDPGGFGTVTITKNITIDGTTGAGFGSILAAGTNGVNVNDSATASPNSIIVSLRNLSINGAGTGVNGVNFTSGKIVHVENCVIFGFTSNGINVSKTNSAAELYVYETVVRNCATGIKANTTGTTPSTQVQVVIRNSAVDQNTSEGIRIENNVRANISNTSASGNTLNGFVVITTTAVSEMNLENCVAASNKQWGVFAGGVGTTRARLSNCSITNNVVAGVQINAGGAVDSFGNNKIQGNTTNVSGGALNPAAQS